MALETQWLISQKKMFSYRSGVTSIFERDAFVKHYYTALLLITNEVCVWMYRWENDLADMLYICHLLALSVAWDLCPRHNCIWKKNKGFHAPDAITKRKVSDTGYVSICVCVHSDYKRSPIDKRQMLVKPCSNPYQIMSLLSFLNRSNFSYFVYIHLIKVLEV